MTDLKRRLLRYARKTDNPHLALTLREAVYELKSLSEEVNEMTWELADGPVPVRGTVGDGGAITWKPTKASA